MIGRAKEILAYSASLAIAYAAGTAHKKVAG